MFHIACTERETGTDRQRGSHRGREHLETYRETEGSKKLHAAMDNKANIV